jgi:hypothetical protein
MIRRTQFWKDVFAHALSGAAADCLTTGDLVRLGDALGVSGIDLEQRVCGVCGAEQYIAIVAFHAGAADQDGVLGKVREVIEARVPAACDIEVRAAFVAEGTVKA